MYYEMKIKIAYYFTIVVAVLINQAVSTRHCHNETGRCYWMGNGSKSWEDARTACQSEGGDLAVMETEELWNFVENQFSFR